MNLYLLTLISFVLLVISILRDKRSLWNPIFLIVSIVTTYLSIGTFVYHQNWYFLHSLFLGSTYLIIPFFILVSGLFLIYNGFVLLKKEGKSLANHLSLLLGVAIIIFLLLTFLCFYLLPPMEYQWLTILFICAFFTFFVLGSLFIGFLTYSILYHFMPKRKDYDFIIIHGAGLLGGKEVTPLLQKRIDKAIEAFHSAEKPEVQIIASGGQGPDELLSEAQAIANYLDSIDFPMDRVILEEKSTTTYENLLFSKQIGEEKVTNPSFLFVTNDYHVLRTSLYAKKLGLVGEGLGCKTASYYIPSAFIREYVAFLTKLKFPLLILFSLFFIGILISLAKLLR